jgi:hypothetical protein
MSMKHRVGAFVLVVCSALLLAAAQTAGAATNPRVYKDPAGDANGGPDLRSVTIGDTGGMITIALKVVGLKAPAAGEALPSVITFFDTNGGDSPEYGFYFLKTSNATEWCVVRVAASERCIPVTGANPFRASGDTYTLRIASSDLAGATSFGFWVLSASDDESGTMTEFDTSPSDWWYTLRSVELLLGSPTLQPATPVAGKAFRITIPLTRSDGAKLPGGKGTSVRTSVPTVGGEMVVPVLQVGNGAISIRLDLPATATGKLLKLTVNAMSGRMEFGPGISTYTLGASRTFSFRVA